MSGRSEKGADNLLKIIGEGRHAALDMRLVGGGEPSGPTKVTAAADRIAAIWRENRDREYRDDTGALSPIRGGFQIVDFDPDNTDGLEPGDVNIAYAVHSWARGSGVASEAVLALCEHLRSQGIGRRAAIRVEPENIASVRVAEKCGFRHIRRFPSSTDTHSDGTPVLLSLYVLEL